MTKVYRRQLVEGVSVPAIIHNSNFFFIHMAVYEDGIVSCWQKSDLEQLKEDLQEGWLVPGIPIGEELSVHGLGAFPVLDAHWDWDINSFYQHIIDVVHVLNPEMTNLYRTTQREIDKWEQARVSWTASPTPYKLDGNFGYDLLDGDDCYIFYRQADTLQLTSITVYADKTIQIAAAGDKYFTPEEIDQLFAEQILCTTPNQTEWVQIAGLGQVLLAPPVYGELSGIEKQKELKEKLSRIAGEADAHDRCLAAYHRYLTEPSEWAREALRKAYEAVPEHERMYLGDMDTRDADFIRILDHPERKRQV